MQNNLQIVSQLLSAGANKYLTDDTGYNALHYGILYNFYFFFFILNYYLVNSYC